MRLAFKYPRRNCGCDACNQKRVTKPPTEKAFKKSLYSHYKTAVVKIFHLTQRGVLI
jgi:hypothetical protein